MIQVSEPTRMPIRRPHRPWLLAAALTIGLLAAGCGSDDTPDTVATDSATDETSATDDSAATSDGDDGGDSAAGGDGCDLISDELAADILGVEIVRREAHTETSTGGVSCVKGTERVADLSQAYYVSVSVTPGGAAFFDETIAGAGTEAITGVGDQAAFLSTAASLIIAADTNLVTVQVIQAGAPGTLEECITVAEEVLDNL